MKHVNGYWIDENGNRWNDDYSEELVVNASNSLINCSGCTDCFGCTECKNCTECNDCSQCKWCSTCQSCYACSGSKKSNDCCHCRGLIGCRSCKNCDDCVDCTECSKCNDCFESVRCYMCKESVKCFFCKYCIGCKDCYFSNSCIGCEGCKFCDYCRSCDNYRRNPSVYRMNNLGNDNEVVFYHGETLKGNSIQIIWGSFKGNLEQFEAVVMKKYQDDKNCCERYFNEIQKVKLLFELV